MVSEHGRRDVANLKHVLSAHDVGLDPGILWEEGVLLRSRNSAGALDVPLTVASRARNPVSRLVKILPTTDERIRSTILGSFV